MPSCMRVRRECGDVAADAARLDALATRRCPARLRRLMRVGCITSGWAHRRSTWTSGRQPASGVDRCRGRSAPASERDARYAWPHAMGLRRRGSAGAQQVGWALIGRASGAVARRLGLTQRDLGATRGLAQSTISRLENGRLEGCAVAIGLGRVASLRRPDGSASTGEALPRIRAHAGCQCRPHDPAARAGSPGSVMRANRAHRTREVRPGRRCSGINATPRLPDAAAGSAQAERGGRPRRRVWRPPATRRWRSPPR